MEKDINLRKYRNLLYYCGLGVIMFSFWGIIKWVLLFVMQYKSLYTYMSIENEDTVVKVLAVIFLIILMGIDTAWRLYIGKNSILKGRGKPVKNRYLILAKLSVLLSVASFAISLIINPKSFLDVTQLTGLVIEMTYDVILCEIIYYSYRIRKAVSNNAA